MSFIRSATRFLPFFSSLSRIQDIHNGKLSWLMVLSAFLAGATTEQIGLTVVFAAIVASVVYVKRGECSIRKSFFVILPCIIGLLSILLSPGIIRRIGRENLELGMTAAGFNFNDMFMIMFERLVATSQIMYYANFGIIFAIFGVCLGFLPIFNKAFSKKLKACFLYSAIAAVIHFMPKNSAAVFILFVLSIMFITVMGFLFIKHKEYTFSGILLICAIFSLFITLGTGSQEPRVAFPFIILIIGVSASLVINYSLKLFLLLPAYIIMCCVIFLPIIFGYQENKRLMGENIDRINASLASGENIFFSIDFVDTHRFLMAHDDGFFYNSFRNFYEIPNYIRIFFFSRENPPIYTYFAFRLKLPMRYKSGEVLMPLSLVMSIMVYGM